MERVLYRLGSSLDSTRKMVIVNDLIDPFQTLSIEAKLKYADTRQCYCGHNINTKVLVDWIKNKKTPNQNICPYCEKDKKSKKRFSNKNVKLVSNKGDEGMEGEEGEEESEDIEESEGEEESETGGEESEMEEGTEGTEEEEEEEELPKFIRSCIKDHFKAQKLPKELEKGDSEVVNKEGESMGKGIFAKEDLNILKPLGIYTGEILYDKEVVDKSDSDKIFGFHVGSVAYWVDSQDTDSHWGGLINHKWSWPYNGEDDPEKNMPEFWKDLFSNVNIDEEGTLHPRYQIFDGDELYLDYGIDYWKDKKPRPVWNWPVRNTKEIEVDFNEEFITFQNATEKYPKLKKYVEASTIVMTLRI